MKHKALLLLGPEEGDKTERFERERAEILSADPSTEITTLYATDDIEKSVLGVLRQPSLFASTRLVVIKCMDGLKPTSGLIKNLTEFIKDPEEDVFLIMISNDVRSPFPPAVGKLMESQIFYEDFESNRVKWIRDQFNKAGFYAAQDAIDEVMQSVANNKQEMKEMITSITSYYRNKDESKKKITAEDIALVVSRQKGEDGHTLFRKTAERDLEGALMILSAINLQDPTKLITALMTLTNDFRQAETLWTLVKEKRMDLRDALSNAVALQTTFPITKISIIRRDEFRACINNYTKKEISQIIAYLVKNDTEIKAAGPEGLSLFETMIYNIIVNGGRECGERLYQELFPKIV